MGHGLIYGNRGATNATKNIFGQRDSDFASALSHYIAVSHTDFFVTLSQLSCFFAFIALHDQHFETDENLSCRVDDSIIL